MTLIFKYCFNRQFQFLSRAHEVVPKNLSSYINVKYIPVKKVVFGVGKVWPGFQFYLFKLQTRVRRYIFNRNGVAKIKNYR